MNTYLAHRRNILHISYRDIKYVNYMRKEAKDDKMRFISMI